MSKRTLRSISLLLVIVLLLGALSVASAQGRTRVVWFVGLGTGSDPAQQEAQENVVARFNASQNEVELVMNVVAHNAAADALSTLIASSQAPDIIGPVGFDGSNGFEGNWLDIGPLVEAEGYDLGQFPEGLVDFYRTKDGLVGLPFATFPSFLFYRPELFDEAGLNYPPAAYGEPYVMPDGTEVEWTVDVLREVGMLLTVDANGEDATSPNFDSNNIIQWGYAFQWSDGRAIATLFGAAEMIDENGNAVMPENWRAGWNWYYDGIWTDKFIPNQAQVGSDLLGSGNPFNSGNLAMAQSHLWYTCCLEGTTWDAAALPSYNGEVTAKLHSDTFRIHKDTKNPTAAFKALTFLVGEGSLELLSVYGGMPAREADQPEFFAKLDQKYTQGVNWDVAVASGAYADNPSHEAWLPNYLKTKDRINSFQTYVESTPGLDINAEIDRLIADLQVFYEEVR